MPNTGSMRGSQRPVMTRRRSSAFSEAMWSTMTETSMASKRSILSRWLAIVSKVLEGNDTLLFFVVPVFVLPLISLAIHGVWLANAPEDDVPPADGAPLLQNPGRIRASLNIITRDIVIVLGLLVTSSFVVLQMFASNFLPHTISLFFKNRGVFAILFFMCLSVLYCEIINVLSGDDMVPWLPLVVAYMVRFLTLSITFPYFNFLVNFLSPEALIRQVRETGLGQIERLARLATQDEGGATTGTGAELSPSDQPRRAGSVEKIAENAVLPDEPQQPGGGEEEEDAPVKETADKEVPADVSKIQIEWINAIELLADIGLSTLKQKDKENANNAMLSLYTIACAYTLAKEAGRLPESWFNLSPAVRNRPDFSSLSISSLELMVKRRTWAEWKILRAYQLLFETANTLNSSHLCGLAAFYTRKVGELAAEKGDMRSMDTCVKFMNTYIRYLVNAKDVRILSGVLNEYRELAIEMVRLGSAFEIARTALQSDEATTSGSTASLSFVSSIAKAGRRLSERSASFIGPPQAFRRRDTGERGHKSAVHPVGGMAQTGSDVLGDSFERKNWRLSDSRQARGSTSSMGSDKSINSSRKRPRNETSRRHSILDGIRGTLRLGKNSFADENARVNALASDYEKRVEHCDRILMTIVHNMRYYLVLSSNKGLGVIAEILAHDVGSVCAEAYAQHCRMHEDLLSVFLTLDDTQKGTTQATTNRGIRRAQVKLACTYLVHDEAGFAREIQRDMDDEPLFRIRHIYREMMWADTEMFWEITFRTKNLGYLPPAFRDKLPTFFSWFSRFSFAEVKVAYDLANQDLVRKDASTDPSRLLSSELHGGRNAGDAELEEQRQKNFLSRVDHANTIARDFVHVAVTAAEKRAGSKPHALARLGQLLVTCCRFLRHDPMLHYFFRYTVCATVLIVAALRLDAGSITDDSFLGPLPQSQTVDVYTNLLSGMAVATVLMFVLLCVTSMIILQLVAARYKFHPDMLSFLRDPALFCMLCLIVISCMLATLLGVWAPGGVVGPHELAFLTMLVTFDLVLVVVYFLRLFYVLQPDRILSNVRSKAFTQVFLAAQVAKVNPELLRRSSTLRTRRPSDPGTMRKAMLTQMRQPTGLLVDKKSRVDNITEIDFGAVEGCEGGDGFGADELTDTMPELGGTIVRPKEVEDDLVPSAQPANLEADEFVAELIEMEEEENELSNELQFDGDETIPGPASPTCPVSDADGASAGREAAAQSPTPAAWEDSVISPTSPSSPILPASPTSPASPVSPNQRRRGSVLSVGSVGSLAEHSSSSSVLAHNQGAGGYRGSYDSVRGGRGSMRGSMMGGTRLSVIGMSEVKGSSSGKGMLSAEKTAKSLISDHQFNAHEHMKRICDFGFACVQQSDEVNLNAALTTLRWLVHKYCEIKPRLPNLWFMVSGRLRRTSDFINFSAERVVHVSKTRVWFEWKVFAQYLLIFDECIASQRSDSCKYISLNTRFIAEDLIEQNDLEAYKVTTKFFNTFLRRAITANNLAVATHVISQYQKLLTRILRLRCSASSAPFLRDTWSKIVVEQAWYLRYYAQVALEKDYGVVAESVAMSLGEICSAAHRDGVEVHTEVLKLLLTVDDVAEQDQESLVGIRRAQVKLALFYLSKKERKPVELIAHDMVDESYHRIIAVVQELLTTNRPEFWEVTDFGVPSEFLTEQEKQLLPVFFDMVEEERARCGNTPHHSKEPVSTAVKRMLTAENDYQPRTLMEAFKHRKTVRNTTARRGSIANAVKGTLRLGMNRLAQTRSAAFSQLSVSADILQDEEDTDWSLEDFLDLIFGKISSKRSQRSAVFSVVLPLFVSACAVAILLVGSAALEGLSLADLSASFAAQRPKDAMLPMEMVLRSFSVIAMCSLIALQKTAARMVRHVWLLYRHSTWVQAVWIANLATVMLGLWTAVFNLGTPRPVLGVVLLLFASVSLLTLYPYFSSFFVFLDEDKLLTHIVVKDLQLLSVLSSTRVRNLDISDNVSTLVHSMQRVTDFASSTIRVKNKNNTVKCITSLYCIGKSYMAIKGTLPPTFFGLFLVRSELATSPDFSRLTKGFKGMIHEEKTWIEWKLLRQYLFLFQESIDHVTDVCYRIAICTKQLAAAAMRMGDFGVLDLCIKFLNTYLKVALDRRQVRLVFSILFQYRKLAESMLNLRILAPTQNAQAHEAYVVDVAWYFRHYALVAQKAKMDFLCELIAHDLSLLCMAAFRLSSPLHDKLLQLCFEAHDPTLGGAQRGVRRAQLKLAAFYESMDAAQALQRVVAEISAETNAELVGAAFADLTSTRPVSATFWEINERMYNIDHLGPKQRSALDKVVAQLPEEMRVACQTANENAQFTRLQLTSGEGMQIKLMMSSGARASPIQLPTSGGQGEMSAESIDAAFANFSREIATRARKTFYDAESKTTGPGNFKASKRHLLLAKMRTAKHSLHSMQSKRRGLGSNRSVEAGTEQTEKDLSSDELLQELTNLVRISWIPIAITVPLSIVLTVATSAADGLTTGFSGFAMETFTAYADGLDFGDKQRISKTLAKGAVVIFAIVMTPTLIMLQINSRHLLGVIADQYFSDLRVYSMLTFYTVSSVYLLWANYCMTPDYAPLSPIILGTLLVFAMVNMLFPYFATLFEFLDPAKVVGRMLLDIEADVSSCQANKSPSTDRVARAQVNVNKVLQQLTGFAGASVLEQNKQNFTSVVRVLSSFGDSYLGCKNHLVPLWFDATTKAVRNTQDFASLDLAQLLWLKDNKTWIESKLLRQYLALFNESLHHMPDGCQLVAIETVKIGQRAIEVADMEALWLVAQMFNTFIRACLNSRGIRAVYNTLHQYRQFGELLIVSKRKDKMLPFAVEVARYMRYYAATAAAVKLEFVVETIAFDLASLCESAYLLAFDDKVTNDRILTELLSMYDFLQVQGFAAQENSQEYQRALCTGYRNYVQSIGRACARLATLYLDHNDEARAFTIAERMRTVTTTEVLESIRNKLESVTDRDFWEINDRGANFDYLPENRRDHLMSFFTWTSKRDFRQRSTTVVDTVAASRERSRISRSTTSASELQKLGSVVSNQSQMRLLTTITAATASSGGNEDGEDSPQGIMAGRAAGSLIAPRQSAARPRSISDQDSSGGGDEAVFSVIVPEEEQAAASARVSAIVMGAAVMQRKIRRIRAARARHLRIEKEMADMEEGLKAGTEKAVSAEKNLVSGPRMTLLETDESMGLDSTGDEEVPTIELEGKPGLRVSRKGRHSSVGVMTHAHRLRMSTRGSAYNLGDLLAEGDVQQPAEDGEAEGVGARRPSVVAGRAARTRSNSRAKDQGLQKKGTGRSKEATSAWARSLYVLPCLLLVALLGLLLLDCGIASGLREHTACDGSALLRGFTSTSPNYIKYRADTLSGLSLIMMTFLGCVVTVSTIVLQIVSTRYTPRVAALFLRNLRIVANLITFFTSVLFVQVQASLSSHSFVSPMGYMVSIALSAVSFTLLMPYIAHLLRFLDAAKIFREIAHEGLSYALDKGDGKSSARATGARRPSLFSQLPESELGDSQVGSNTGATLNEGAGEDTAADKRQAELKRQVHVISSLDQISDYTLTALRLKDKHNAFHGIDLLCAFTVSFIRGKSKKEHRRVGSGKTVLEPVSKDPDFVSLADAMIADMEKTQTWVEWKAHRQLLKMFEVSIGEFNDAVLRVARGLRHIGQTSIRYGDPAGAQLTAKFLNTILQISITRGDDRAADTIVLQYRFLLEYCMNYAKDRINEATNDLIFDMIGYMQHYAHLGLVLRLPSITEHIVHDLCTLSAFSRHLELDVTHDLIMNALGTFLRECILPEVNMAKGFSRIDYLPRGVLRALMKLAAIYVCEFGDDLAKHDTDAKRIWLMVKGLHSSTLKALWNDFKMLSSQESWEMSDRGQNVDSLTTAQKAAMVRFYSLFKRFDVDQVKSVDEIARRLQEIRRDGSASSSSAPPASSSSSSPSGGSLASVAALVAGRQSA